MDIQQFSQKKHIVSSEGLAEKITQKPQQKNNDKTIKKPSHKNKTHNKDLMRLERQIYEIKKPEQSEQEYVIRKLMTKKEKPQIGLVDRSPLLQRLQFMMPIFKQSQDQLSKKEITQNDKIDCKLEQLPSQSESSSEQQQQQIQEKRNNKLPPGMIHQVGFQPMYYGNEKKSGQLMVQQQLQNLTTSQAPQQLQINFLTYPYLKPQQIQNFNKQKAQKKQQTKINEQNMQQLKSMKPEKKVLIQEINHFQN